MDVVQRLEGLMNDPKANRSEIIHIYFIIVKEGTSAVSSAMPLLKDSAVHLLSPELMKILEKHELDAFSYILVANKLLNVDDVKEELENGDALTGHVPPNAIRKLKAELGVASVLPSATPAAERAPPTQLEKPQVLMSNTNDLDPKIASNTDKIRLPIEIKNECSSMKNVNGMAVYKLPLERSLTFAGASSIIKRFSFGEPDPFGSKGCKTILLMGATGSGKTTMINAMINYVLDVQWEDPFRFMLIDEDGTRNQAFSQTSEITAYDIHYRNGFRIPFSLTIVDTPGFGDTRRIERDEEVTSAIKEFFEHENGIQALDAVGFVVHSSLARLTSAQTYIFNTVLSIFGKDIEKNVRFLATFADGGQPPVLAVIREAKLPCLLDSNGEPCHQVFNNRAMYVSNQIPGDQRSPLDWNDAMQNFQSFFAELSKMPITSLELTKKVLNSLENFRNIMQDFQTTIQAHLMKMEELRKIEEIIALNKENVNANKDFEITVKVCKKKQIELKTNEKALNCTICKVTCRRCYPNSWMPFPAFWELTKVTMVTSGYASAGIAEKLSGDLFEFIAKDENLRRIAINSLVGTAAAVGGAGAATAAVAAAAAGAAGVAVVAALTYGNECQMCPKRCAKEHHSYELTKWEFVQEDETRTFHEIRKKYDDAMEKTLNAEELKNALQGEAAQLKSDIIEIMDKSRSCLNYLKEIALCGASPLSAPEYINLMIEDEKKNEISGHEERIKSLEDIKRTAELTKDVTDGGDLAKQYKN
ncbi:uncharacterized protein LOC130689885 [Daphnia carinata]|uniref:uncharacterized protein LOC130689885 n=1 Tax=Daphnia carinata TaxID=120202 RepID=UPI002579E9B5|nr:uncharacterized protein LOC130689885 [Daphnia carinata]XP_057368808.1 uncharacterized protein LOC130689885 [Daphnia carinata]